MTVVRLLVAALCCVLVAGCGSTASPSSSSPLKTVPLAEGVWYSLDDGEERNRQDPDTFPIPPREAREHLQPGQVVKLLFAIAVGGDEEVERVWVIVKRREGGDYIGVLDNQPVSTNKLRPGMTIRFQPRNVIAIHPKRVEDK